MADYWERANVSYEVTSIAWHLGQTTTQPGYSVDSTGNITANDTYVSVGPLGLVDFTKLLHSSTVAGGFSSPFSFETVAYYENVVGANNSTTDGSTTTFDGFGNYCTLLLHGAYDANDVATYQGTTKTQFSLDLYQFTGTADPSALGIMAVPEFGDRCSTN